MSTQLSGDDFLLNAIRVVTGRTNSSVPFKSFSALLGKFSDLSTALKAAMWLVEHFATGKPDSVPSCVEV